MFKKALNSIFGQLIPKMAQSRKQMDFKLLSKNEHMKNVNFDDLGLIIDKWFPFIFSNSLINKMSIISL